MTGLVGVAYAVVRDEVPTVFLAEDIDVPLPERISRVDDVPPDLIGAQLQFTPLFQD